MQAIGELVDNKIIVQKPRDVGRFYNKSHLGKTKSGDKLELDLLEGVFLLGEGKLKLFHNKKEIDFQSLLKTAAQNISNFEIKYLIFRDLRKRGNAVRLLEENDEFDFVINKKNDDKPFFVSTFYERNSIQINEIKDLIKHAIARKGDLWFGVVDEEGDITYYDVSKIDITGETKEYKFSKTHGLLLENRVVIFDKKNAEKLFEKEFFGKPFGEGIQLSMVEALYLMEKDELELEKADENKKISLNEFKDLIKKSQPDIDMILMVFKDLKKRGLIVKTGFKFGAHFRAYTKKPEETHAEYLVHAASKNFKTVWAEISRAVRLAHSVNKEIIFAYVEKEKIDYIKFGRLRP